MNEVEARAEHIAGRRNRRALTRLSIVLAAVAVPLAVLKATASTPGQTRRSNAPQAPPPARRGPGRR
jgi:hypothetical protein